MQKDTNHDWVREILGYGKPKPGENATLSMVHIKWAIVKGLGFVLYGSLGIVLFYYGLHLLNYGRDPVNGAILISFDCAYMLFNLVTGVATKKKSGLRDRCWTMGTLLIIAWAWTKALHGPDGTQHLLQTGIWASLAFWALCIIVRSFRPKTVKDSEKRAAEEAE